MKIYISNYLLFFLIAAVVVSCTSNKRETAETNELSRQPNIVFMFSDQQSSDMLGCYGNEQIITPNIDKMAAGGGTVRPLHIFQSRLHALPGDVNERAASSLQRRHGQRYATAPW